MEKSEGASDNQRPWQSYHTVYTNAKAGMDGVDKEKVQRIVYEMSKGSKYFENEERKEAIMKQKVEHMHSRCAKLSPTDISHYQKVADKRIAELEATRDLSRIWLHVDMDAFYAAVETLSDPSLKGKPMAVGSMSMISTANYEARKFGVRAAMPGFIARKLCPDLLFVPPDFKKYTYYSDLTRKVFRSYDPNFTAASLDEAYLDITEVCRERDVTGGEIAEELRSRVYEETGLTCSAGVGPNRLLAKVCSDINKPNGQFVLQNDRMAVMTFISSLPIRKIGGIGKVTENVLKSVFGISTCEELLQKSGFLCALFSHSTTDFFLSVGLGLGGTDTPQVRFRKSISNERTFSATDDLNLLYQKLAEIAENLSADMQEEGLSGRTLTLKLKTSSFEVRTRALTLQKYICSKDDILKNASKLLKAELPVSLRLIGLRMSHFKEEEKVVFPSDPTQKTLAAFVRAGDASRNNLDDQSSLGSVDEVHLMNEMENDFCLDHHKPCHHQSGDPLDSNHLSDLNCSSCNSQKNVVEQEKIHDPSSNEVAGKEKTTDAQPKGKQVLQSLETDSSVPWELKSCNLIRVNGNTDIHAQTNDVASSSLTEDLIWVDDYKCSLCGIELPSNFIEERQEHSDFHLAERLQKKESGTYPPVSMRQRIVRKEENTANQSRQKKRKSASTKDKYLPIDTFFVKSNQNF
ncbi:hypothetical protein SLA2020_210840 [Shorea laevis]